MLIKKNLDKLLGIRSDKFRNFKKGIFFWIQKIYSF